MFPTLSIGPVAIPTYPFFVLLAFWAGMALAARRADRLGLDGNHAYNAGLYGLIAGIIGARVWFVLAHWDNYAGDLSQALSLSRGALAVPEGLLAAGLVALLYLQRNRVPLGAFVDAVAPGLALALALVSVGAFLGGVNLGAPSPSGVGIEMAGTTRHPVQLYQAGANLAIAAWLYFSRYRPWPGFQFWLFVILYSASRLLLEVLVARPPLIGDSLLAVQMFALLSIVVALAVMAYNFTDTQHTHSEGL